MNIFSRIIIVININLIAVAETLADPDAAFDFPGGMEIRI